MVVTKKSHTSVFDFYCWYYKLIGDVWAYFDHPLPEVASKYQKLGWIQENDCHSNFGSNIRNICILNNTNDILACEKDSVKYFPINVSYECRVNLLKELLSIKRNPHHLEGFSLEEVEILSKIWPALNLIKIIIPFIVSHNFT